jgi:hypothetical protein
MKTCGGEEVKLHAFFTSIVDGSYVCVTTISSFLEFI